MKKLFISQPMRDKTDEEIQKEREEAFKVAKEKLGEDLELIDSFIDEAPSNITSLWLIARSIELLGQADVVYFVDGWKKARGCRIEHACAVEYDMDIIDD